MTSTNASSPAPGGALDDWQHAEPSHHDGGATIFSGSTFALTDPVGRIGAEPQGFFVADRRVLSSLVLELDGWELSTLRVTAHGEDTLEVVQRAMPTTPAYDGEPALLLSRALHVQPGVLRYALTLRNGSPRERTVRWRLRIAADFADIFAVKEGRVHVRQQQGRVHDGELELRSDDLWLTATCSAGSVLATGDGLEEAATLSPHTTVVREVVLQAWTPEGRVTATPSATAGSLRVPQVSSPSSDLVRAVASSVQDLEALRIHDDATGADTIAAGAPWFMTLFGRDSLITSLMTSMWDDALPAQVLQSLASRQGTVVDAASEEEPGRILHETRMTTGSTLFAAGRTGYYGSTDATPLFVVTLADAVRNGLPLATAAALMPAVDGCLSWLEDFGDLDGDGLIESVRRSDGGLVNQGWKDSWNANIDAGGAVVTPPLNLVEVQAYVYAAYRAKAYLDEALGIISGLLWDDRADALRANIDRSFWLPDLATYALALGPDKEPLASSASNAGHLLWTGAALPERVGPLSATIMSRTLRTHWGLRTLASDHPAFDPLGYHTGSIWPHDTALVAWGLSRWGIGGAAAELAEALLRTSTHFDSTLPELIAGLEVGDAMSGAAPVRFPTACSPQAWSAASPLLLIRAVLGFEIDVPSRIIRINDQVPDAWLPLTVHGLTPGDLRLTVRATYDSITVHGVPDEFAVVHGPRFGGPDE